LYGFTARGEEMYSKKEIIQCNYFALMLVLHLYEPSRPQITLYLWLHLVSKEGLRTNRHFFSWTAKVLWGKTFCDYSQQRKTKDQTTQQLKVKILIRPKGTQQSAPVV